MATKPTEPYDWALSGTATDPAAKRTNGWLDNDTLPAAEANFLWQALGKWAGFFDVAFDNDGWLTLDTEQGRLEVTTDTVSVHLFDHLPTGAATCVMRSDQVHARGEMRIGVVTGAANEGVIAEQISGLVNARSLQVRGEGGNATGINTGAILVSQTSPANADMATLHPRDQSLYQGNLIKMQALVEFIWDAGGALSSSGPTINAYNVASSALNTSTTPDQFELTPTDDFTPICLVATIVDLSITGPQMKADLVRIPGSPNKVGIRLYYFNAGAWGDALAGNAVLANVTVYVSVMVI